MFKINLIALNVKKKKIFLFTNLKCCKYVLKCLFIVMVNEVISLCV